MAKQRVRGAKSSKGKSEKLPVGVPSRVQFLKTRFPDSQTMWLVGAMCLFPVQVWAFMILFREVPALMIRLDVWSILVVMAYTQGFAVVEGGVLWLLLLGTAVLLPQPWLREKMVAKSCLIILLATIFAILAQFNLQTFLTMSINQVAGWVTIYLFFATLCCYGIHRSRKTEQLLTGFVSRLAPLTAFYLLIGGISLLIVIGRNLGIL